MRLFTLLMLPLIFALYLPNFSGIPGNQSLKEKFFSNRTTFNETYKVNITKPSNVKVNYLIENDTLKLFFEVWRGNPCQYLEAEVKKMGCTNCYEILLYLKQVGYCIQVLPKTPATTNVTLELSPESKNVYIKVTYRGLYLGENCTELKIRLKEAIRKGNLTEAEKIAVQLWERCGIKVNITEEMRELNKTAKKIAKGIGKMIREEIKELIKEIKRAVNKTEIEEKIRNITKKLEEIGEINASDLGERIKIIPGKIIVEGLNIIPERRIRIKVKNIEIEVERFGHRIRAGNISVDVETEIEVVNGTIKTKKGVVRVSPVDIERELRIKIKNAVLKDEEKPVYEVEGEKEGKLLGIIPVKLKIKAKIDAENGRVIALKKPWWAFLVFG